MSTGPLEEASDIHIGATDTKPHVEDEELSVVRTVGRFFAPNGARL